MSPPEQLRLAALSVAMGAHLTNGLIPFWRARAIDPVHGGYRTAFDEQGRALPQPEKYFNVQARMLWWFSRLARAYPDIADYAALARQGADFLIDTFWEPQHGGWRWKVAADGSSRDDGKVVYGQSFGIFAFAEYTRATGDPRGLRYAGQTFDLLQTYAADTRYGGYYENLEPDWTPSAPGFHAGDRKSLDSHMHLMEAFTTLAAVSDAESHRLKLREIIDLIAARMVDPVIGCGLNQFSLDWQPLPAIPIRRTFNAERVGASQGQPVETTSYGHNTELAWLMRLALQTLGDDPRPYQRLMRGLLDHAVQGGVDWEYGGIYRDGVRGGEALVKDKEFWQHAEALVGFLDGYDAYGDGRYLDAAETLWRFVDRHMIAHEVGEWRILLNRTGQPIDSNVGSDWKGAYHTGRAMIECTERLRRLAGAAGDLAPGPS